MPPSLASIRNPRLRWIRRLLEDAKARRAEGLWVGEGVRLAAEVLREGLAVRLWALVPGWGREGGRAAEVRSALEARGHEMVEVSSGAFRDLSDTRAPQGVLCVFEAPSWRPDDALRGVGPVLLLDRLQDPGNLGTLARSAEAAGCSGLLLAPGTVDPGNPKALRASAGALLRLPTAGAVDVAALVRASGRALYATAGTGGVPYHAADLTRPFALLVGQEGSGVAPHLAQAAEAVLTVPMAGRMESLNAAVAATVILFEAARQRGAPSCPE